jgi:hypothetical protein
VNPGTSFPGKWPAGFLYKDVSLIITDLIRLVILIAFPIIALWLPSHMRPAAAPPSASCAKLRRGKSTGLLARQPARPL